MILLQPGIADVGRDCPRLFGSVAPTARILTVGFVVGILHVPLRQRRKALQRHTTTLAQSDAPTDGSFFGRRLSELSKGGDRLSRDVENDRSIESDERPF